MASLLTSQWLDACIIVPTEDCDIIQQLAQRAAAEGHAVYDLAALRKLLDYLAIFRGHDNTSVEPLVHQKGCHEWFACGWAAI